MSERELETGTRRFLPAPGAAYFAPDPDAALDQGDDPDICPACGAGRHDECRDGAELGDDDVEVCDCRDGECGGGEWIEVGYITEPESVTAGGLVLPAGARVFTAPVGTPPPGRAGLRPTSLVLDEPADLDRIGPPIPVLWQETRPDGHYVEVSVGPAHPAYAALAEMAADLQVSVAADGPEPLSDNGCYVRFRPCTTRRVVGAVTLCPATLPDCDRSRA